MADQVTREGFFYRVPTEVVVHADGREIRKFDDVARGDQWNPEHAWDDDDVIRKARDYTEGLLPKPKTDALIEAVFNLEGADDVSAVARAMVNRLG